MEVLINKDLKNELDFEKAFDRILASKGNMLIFSPHGSWLLRYCREDIIETLKKEIKSGSCHVKVPIYMQCPKRSIPFNRRGAYLFPKEQLLYEALVDSLLEGMYSKIDKERVFSYRINDISASDDLFKKESGYVEMQKRFVEIQNEGYHFALKTDLVSYYSNINLHELQNYLLADIPDKENVINGLNGLLLAFSEQNSQSLVQGFLASDLLANYYLSFIENHSKERHIPSCRYVDDLYFFFKTEKEANLYLLELELCLSNKYLYMNENKTKILPISEIIKHISYVDNLFNKAVEEYRELSTPEMDIEGYTFKIDWDLDEDSLPSDEEIELEATKSLFECEVSSEIERNRIDRFCLNRLAMVGDTSKHVDVLENFENNHPNSEIYANYLRITLLKDSSSHGYIIYTLSHSYGGMSAYSKHWLLTCLIQYKKSDLAFEEDFVLQVMKDFKDRNNPAILRAICAIFCLRFGSGTIKTEIREIYQECPCYIQIAIYLAVKKYISGNQQNVMLREWRTDNIYNQMVKKVEL